MKSVPDPDSNTPVDPDVDLTQNNASVRTGWFRRSFNPFRIATLRGLGVLLPPLLTIMLFAWAWNTIDRAILRPVESLCENCVAWAIEDIRDDSVIQAEMKLRPDAKSNLAKIDERLVYTATDGVALVELGNQWLPLQVVNAVDAKTASLRPANAHEYYRQYVQLRYLKRHLVIPALLALLLASMYLLGKLLAARIGRFAWHSFESLINRLPIIRNVYSSVKQVTDFAFSENEVQFTRVVAVEYPRKGIWSMGFVTGESMLDIRVAAGEPMLSVLMPTSPMPATGFTISIPKSQTIDLNITIDQAIQFCVSCGVVVPDHQSVKSNLEGEIRRRIEPADPKQMRNNNNNNNNNNNASPNGSKSSITASAADNPDSENDNPTKTT